MKPSRGRISWGPNLGEMWGGLFTDGPMARTVRDAAALLDVMSGYEPGDPYWALPPSRPFEQEVNVEPGRLQIAFTPHAPNGIEVHPDCVAAVVDAAALLASLGHTVVEDEPDWEDPDAFDAVVKLVQTSTASLGVTDLTKLEPINRVLAEAGLATSSMVYVKALNRLHALARRVVPFWERYDFLLTSTLALPPVPIGWYFESSSDPWEQLARDERFVPFFVTIANCTGQPAASLPLFWSAERLPIGVQLIGRPADDAGLFRLCAELEQARPWRDRRPPIL